MADHVEHRTPIRTRCQWVRGRRILTPMSPGMDGPMPRASDDVKEVFRGLVPVAPGVTVRPMFGNICAFVNGNMFTGLFGEKLFVRVPAGDRERLIAAGGDEFAPMPGRPMKEYAVLPLDWLDDEKGTRAWVDKAHAATAKLPPKQPKPKKK